MVNLKEKNKRLLEFIKNEAPFQPDIALILGSGFGDFASSGKILKSLNTSEIPGYPPSTVEGHKGRIHFSLFGDKKVLVFDGRIHFYEGYLLSDCLIPVLIANYLGAKNLILTNAAGGVNSNFTPGDLMVCTSFLGFNIKSELSSSISLASIELKNKMLEFPSKKINDALESAGLDEKIKLKYGVYWYNKGPTYETPAEIRMSRFLGADAVGMSSVHEAMYAVSQGMEVGCLSCITNLAAGLSVEKLSHEDVQQVASITREKISKLLIKTIDKIEL